MPAQEVGADTPFGIFFPREAATLLNTWHTLGMRGTGWTDIAVTDFFVPEHCTARRKIRGSRPPRESS
jgi:hypothetical protein